MKDKILSWLYAVATTSGIAWLTDYATGLEESGSLAAAAVVTLAARALTVWVLNKK